MPPSRNIRHATTSTQVRGRREIRPPASTATAVCTKKARQTPIHTSSGRQRVDITSVAMKVLSGSSTRKMVPKTTAAVAKSSPTASTLGSTADAARTGQRPWDAEHGMAGAGSAPAPSLWPVVRARTPQRCCCSRSPSRSRWSSSAAWSCCCAARPRCGAGSPRSSSTGRPATPTSPRCAPTSARPAARRGGALRRLRRHGRPAALQRRRHRRPRRRPGVQLDPRPRRVAHLRQGRRRGQLDATLTPEEQQALAAARTGKETP